MRVVVLSDTHLREGQTLPVQVWEGIEGVNLILHAGDIVNPGLLTDLQSLASVEAVQGNCDGWDIDLPQKKIILCEGIRIGITHGAYGLGKTTPERAWHTFERGSVDLIVFGHSHVPYKEWKDGVLLFNPGSPTDKRREPQYSFGILEIHDREFEARHIYF